MKRIVMNKLDLVKDVEDLNFRIANGIKVQESALVEVLKQMAELKRKGVIYAKMHTRQGKYVYLVYPVKDGRRQRVYIGNDKKKIELATESIERGVKYKVLEEQGKQIEFTLNEVRNLLLRTNEALQKNKAA